MVTVSILILAIIIELWLGDPPWKTHPTFLLGELAKKLEPYFKNPNPKIEKVNGVFLAVIAISLVVVPIYFGLKFIHAVFGLFVYVIIAAVILKLTLCIKFETKVGLDVARAVDAGDLVEGRKFVPYYSRRNPEGLTGPQIVSSFVESLAENLPDFKLSSIFYYAFLGVSGAFAVRAVNTLDSVIGFKDAKHINTGWFTATLDTIINYVPSRLTALLIVIASAILGEDWRGAWKIARRDHAKISSINHGWPIAAMAGALRVQLEKPGYFIVGDEIEGLSSNHIMRALRIRNVIVVLGVILILPILLVMGIFLSPLW